MVAADDSDKEAGRIHGDTSALLLIFSRVEGMMDSPRTKHHHNDDSAYCGMHLRNHCMLGRQGAIYIMQVIKILLN